MMSVLSSFLLSNFASMWMAYLVELAVFATFATWTDHLRPLSQMTPETFCYGLLPTNLLSTSSFISPGVILLIFLSNEQELTSVCQQQSFWLKFFMIKTKKRLSQIVRFVSNLGSIFNNNGEFILFIKN